MSRADVLVSPSGPQLFNARLPTAEWCVWVDGPHMRVGELEFVTSLPLVQGYEVSALRSIAADLEGEVRCGHQEPVPLRTRVERSDVGPRLILEIGPMGMYTSELVVQTKSGLTFEALITRSFATYAGKEGLPDGYLAAFLVRQPQGHDDANQTGGHSSDGGDRDHHHGHGSPTT